MRLIKCYIENYGTLSHFSLDFDESLTVVNEQNGFGKSTLASFIKAMFYGLLQTTAQKLHKNERKLRRPWQGGNFGGSLDIEVGEKQYRIERFFGPKASGDTFRLFDLSNGSISNDYSENIGTELFGIDAEGFERSVFFPQLNSETFANTSISAKLMNLVENSDDINNFDNAMDRLKKKKSEYKNAHGKGIIPELKEQINEAEKRLNDGRVALDNINQLSERLKVCESEIAQLEEALANVRRKLKFSAEQEAVKAALNRRDELAEEAASIKLKIEDIMAVYPKGLPRESVLDDTLNRARDLSDAINEYRVLAEDTADNDELSQLRAFFGIRAIKGEEVAELSRKAQRHSEIKSELSAKAEILNTVASTTGSAKKTAVRVLCIIAGLLVIAGCWLLFKTVVAAVIVLIAGVCAGAVAAFLYLKGMIIQNAPKADTVKLKAEYNALTLELDRLVKELDLILEGLPLEGDYVKKAYILTDKVQRLEQLSRSAELREQRLNEKKRKIDGVRAAIADVFTEYGIQMPESGYYEELLKMRDFRKKFNDLTQQLQERELKLADLPEIKAAEGEDMPTGDALVLEEKRLTEQLDSTRKASVELKNEILKLSPTADSVSESESDLSTLNESLAEKENELFTVSKTMEFLEEARVGLTTKYRDPMSEGFKNYAELILGEEVGGFLLDSELNINIERYGMAQHKDYFSAGYKNLIDIAIRFALIDALYKGEKPPVILDDPFVNLDDIKTENALRLLDKLATNRQIIYLTCHSSRCPK